MQDQTTQTEPTTFAELHSFLKETAKMQRENELFFKEKKTETDRRIKETDRQMKETDIQLKEAGRYLKETGLYIMETGRQMKETDKRWTETRREIKELNKKYGGISQSNGEVAEDYFFSSFDKLPFLAGQEYDRISPNVSLRDKRRKIQGEFDLVLYNGSSVVIIEVKYKAKKEHIKEILEKPAIFKLLIS